MVENKVKLIPYTIQSIEDSTNETPEGGVQLIQHLPFGRKAMRVKALWLLL